MEPPAKKPKTGTGRFSQPFSSSEMEKICHGYVPNNTAKATTWALKVFKAWRDHRGEETDGKCPKDLLESPNVDTLNFWLSRFVVEARREDGNPYPPASINNILAGLYRYTMSLAPSSMSVPNFMDTKDPAFRDLRGAMEV